MKIKFRKNENWGIFTINIAEMDRLRELLTEHLKDIVVNRPDAHVDIIEITYRENIAVLHYAVVQ